MLADFYTPLSQAVIELEKRKTHNPLVEAVHSTLSLPQNLHILQQKPHLVMFRQVLTPLHETLLFLRLAKKYNLTPFVIEFYTDKFVSTGNPYKRGLGKLPIHKFTGIQNIEAFEYKTVVDFNTYIGKPLHEVKTIHDETLISFHHDVFEKVTKISPLEICTDASSWFSNYGTSAEYYEHFLKIFICDGILFETFLTTGDESTLTHTTVVPAFKKCIQQFGLKPLIVHATYEDTDQDPEILNHYPKSTAEILIQKGYS